MLKQIFAAILAIGCLVTAITEREEVSITDAGASKERPRMDKYDLDETQREGLEEKKESYEFNADVSRLMDIIINSLYTRKDVFIRELVSNASDALDKVRFVSISEPEYLGNTPDLEIKIDFDDKEKTISITDSGIGMTKAELIKNLGTVAKSGTTAFLEAMGQGSDMSLIGQFGVGFYSAFLVANKVEVTSKSNDDEQYIWTSTADSKFSIVLDPRGDTLGRGTRVTLHLKDDATEFIEQDKLKNLVKKYSEFINYPISLFMSKEVSEEVPVEEEEEPPKEEGDEIVDADKSEGDKDDKEDDLEVKDEGEEEPEAEKEDKPKPRTKTVKQQKWDWEKLNEIKAIWMREKSEISEEDYHGFYKTITRDADNPLTYTHFSAEGEIDFKAILYVPGTAAFDLYDNYYGQKSALKLYVRRVLISEDFDDLMPKYLNFVKGVVDSDDLPLNVSREQLQQLKMIKVMSKKLVRKTIDMIKELADEDEEEESSSEDEKEKKDEKDKEKKDDEKKSDEEKTDDEDKKKDDDKKSDDEEDEKYVKFWKAFGKSIKLGVIEDSSNRMKLAKLLRFYSTEDKDKLTSLDEYISRMKDDQDTILYLPGDTQEAILKSPILKKYTKAGYEVLLLDDPIDEFTTQHLTEYEKRKVKSIAKDDVNLLESTEKTDKKKQQKLKEMYKPLLDWFKKHLGKKVEKVSLSQKLDDAPLYIFTSQYGFSAQMEKINKAQAFQNQEKAASYMMAKKSLEINPNHPVMKRLLEKVKESEDDELDEASTEYVDLLFQMALLNSGFLLDNPSTLTEPLEKLIKVGFGFDREEPIEEIEIEISEDDEEEKDEKKDEEKSGEAPDADEISSKQDEDADQNLEDYYESKGMNPDGTLKEDLETTSEQADDDNKQAFSDDL